MVFLATQIPSDHLAIVVSRSGTDRTLLTVAKVAHDRDIPVIAVTADPSPPLATLADHTLQGFYYPEFRDFGDVVFSASLKYLFDVLFVMAFSKDAERVLALNKAYDALYYSQLDRSR